MTPNEIYTKALEVFGAEAQTLMVFEEMAELQKELCKHARGKDNKAAIAEEIADVEIMLEQMKILHGIERDVRDMKEYKTERLGGRVERAIFERDNPSVKVACRNCTHRKKNGGQMPCMNCMVMGNGESFNFRPTVKRHAAAHH